MTDNLDNSHSGSPPGGSGQVPLEDGQKESPESKSLQNGNLSDEDVDKTRAWTGLWVVVGGDLAIAAAVIIALFVFVVGHSDNAVFTSILSSAFAAISTMTTAYFGIRESSNTAQRSIKHRSAGD
jgi:hypothetical protein